jgi:hypothetical protein
MKYLLLLAALFSAYSFAQATITITNTKVNNNGFVTKPVTVSQTLKTSEVQADACDCIVYATASWYYDGRNKSSSSKASSSARSSASSSIMPKTGYMSWSHPAERVNGEILADSERDVYLISIGADLIEVPGAYTSYTALMPSDGSLPKIALRTTDGQVSEFVEFLR